MELLKRTERSTLPDGGVERARIRANLELTVEQRLWSFQKSLDGMWDWFGIARRVRAKEPAPTS